MYGRARKCRDSRTNVAGVERLTLRGIPEFARDWLLSLRLGVHLGGVGGWVGSPVGKGFTAIVGGISGGSGFVSAGLSPDQLGSAGRHRVNSLHVG